MLEETIDPIITTELESKLDEGDLITASAEFQSDGTQPHCYLFFQHYPYNL